MTVLVRSDTSRADLYYYFLLSRYGFFFSDSRSPVYIPIDLARTLFSILDFLKYVSLRRSYFGSSASVYTSGIWVVFSRVGCMGCAKTIDHGLGVVAMLGL